MRICLISREFPPDTGWGGIGTFVHDLALGLKEIGQDVEVITLSKDRSSSVIDYQGIAIHRVAVGESLEKYQMLLSVMPYSHSLLKALWSMYNKFLELHDRKAFDVVEVPEMFGEGIFLALSKQCPLVVRLYTPHFKFIDDRLHLIDDGFDHQFLAMLEKLTLLTADIASSPSSDLADYVSNAVGLNTDEMVVIRGLIDTNRFSPEGTKALTDESHLKVMFVGRLEERKGVYQLVKAIPDVVKRCPNVRFYFVGNDTKTARGKTSVLSELKKELEKQGCSQYAVFTGPIPHASMPEYFRSADIFVLPSLYDNAPLTCLEAISSGTALIGTSAGGMKEYVVNGESGTIVPPSDVQALANALIDLLSNEEKRKSYGAQARKRALELYDRKITASKTLELYQLASANFEFKKKFALYRKDEDQLLASSEELLKTFDQMIYDLMYRRSLRFRLSYWFHMFKDRPKLFMANLAYNTASGALKLFGRDKLPERLERFKSLIDQQGAVEKTTANKH